MTLITKIVKTAASTAVVLGLAAMTMAPLATSASAGGRGYGYGYGYGSGPGYRYAAPPRAYHYEPRRRSAGSQIAKGVAIGIGALVVGSILADQARRTRNQYYDAPGSPYDYPDY